MVLYPLTGKVMAWTSPNDVGGSAPTIFWNKMFFIFGLSGVLIVPVFVGFLLNLPALSLEILANGQVKKSYLVWLMLHFKDLVVSSFSGFMLDFYFSDVTLVALPLLSPLRRMSCRAVAARQSSCTYA